MEQWNNGTMEQYNRTLKQWNWNNGTMEQWNNGNGTMDKWKNEKM